MVELPNDTKPLVLIGDVLDCLNEIPDESISVVVTSPPYWKHRDYYIKGQIGQEKTPEEYINKLFNIFKELLRKLTRDGAFFLNIGDTYIDKGLQMIPQRLATKMVKETRINIKNKHVGWLLRNQIIWFKPNHMPSPVKTRFTNTYEPIYFSTRDDWEKRVYFNLDGIRIPYRSQQEEDGFGLPKYLDKDGYKRLLPVIKEKNAQLKYNGKFRGHEKNIGASPGGRSSVTGIRYIKKRKIELPQEIICGYLRYWRIKSGISVKEIDKRLGYAHTAGHWFRKDAGGSLPTPEDWIKLKGILKFDNKYDKEMTEMHYVLQGIEKHPKGKNPGDLWDWWKDASYEEKRQLEFWPMKTAKLPYAHFAVFPNSLPEIAIKTCCPPDGVVLDPFAGSGTTGGVARGLNRKSILIELQKDFIPLIKKRCGEIKEVFIS